MRAGSLGKPESLIGILSSPSGLTGTISSPDSLRGSISVSEVVRYITELDYEKLMNHPSVNDIELIKNKSFEDLGLSALSNTELEHLFS